jgi:hypothetical protein
VEQLELDKLGFEISTLKTEGGPAFNPKVYLELGIFHPMCIVSLQQKDILEKNAKASFGGIMDFYKTIPTESD